MITEIPRTDRSDIRRKYSLRPGWLIVNWSKITLPGHYGNASRYMKIGYRTNERPDFYLRNPHTKPLIHNGRKPRSGR